VEKKAHIRNGLLFVKEISKLLPPLLHRSQHAHILKAFHHLNLAFPQNQLVIFPHFLQKPTNQFLPSTQRKLFPMNEKNEKKDDDMRAFGRSYKFSYVFFGWFERLMVSLMSLPNIKIPNCWKQYLVLKNSFNEEVHVYLSKCTIPPKWYSVEVRCKCHKDGKFLSLVIECIERFRTEWFDPKYACTISVPGTPSSF